MDRMTLLAFSVILIFMISCFELSIASPAYREGWSRYQNRLDRGTKHVNECKHSSQNRELCQRCAKVTKSRLAYTMCCERRESTREWCTKFLNFGITSISSTASSNIS